MKKKRRENRNWLKGVAPPYVDYYFLRCIEMVALQTKWTMANRESTSVHRLPWPWLSGYLIRRMGCRVSALTNGSGGQKGGRANSPMDRFNGRHTFILCYWCSLCYLVFMTSGNLLGWQSKHRGKVMKYSANFGLNRFNRANGNEEILSFGRSSTDIKYSNHSWIYAIHMYDDGYYPINFYAPHA